MSDSYNIADIVLMKVAEIFPDEIKNFIAINKYLPEDVPKNYGHKFYPNIHRYALHKFIKDRVYIVFTSRIGVIKKIRQEEYTTGKVSLATKEAFHQKILQQKYDVLWEEREEPNKEKGLGRHNQIETFWEENLIQMKNIERFLTQQEFIEFCEKNIEQTKNK